MKQFFIDKGQALDHMSSLDLLDINGNLEKSKQFIGTVGGELMQIYLVLLGMKFLQEKIEKEAASEVEKQGQKRPGDVLSRLGLINFFLGYIKEIKHDTVFIQVSAQAMALLEEFKLTMGELSKLTEE